MAQYIHEDLERNFERIFNNNQQVNDAKSLSVQNRHIFTGAYNGLNTGVYEGLTNEPKSQ